jgi:hypothetical protein
MPKYINITKIDNSKIQEMSAISQKTTEKFVASYEPQ